MALSKEVKTGILAIGAILLLIFGYNFLKGTNLFQSKRVFYVRYQNVEGLAKSAPVTINGLTVGKVENIQFAKERGWLVVKFSIEDDIEFSKNSIARIYSAGIIGGKSLGVFPDYDVDLIAKDGDTLRGETEDSMMATVTKALGPLEEKVNNTLATIDTLILNVNDIVDEPTRRHLRSAIENLNNTLNSFSDVSENLNIILKNNTEVVDHAFSQLDATATNLTKFTDSLNQLDTGKLARDIQDVVSQMQLVMADMDKGKGTIGKLLKDEAVYNNLEGASRQLEELLQDLKLNPKRYVHFSLFGKRPKQYTKPDNPDL